MKLYLIVTKGKHKGMPIPIKGDLFLIGSEPQCQLRSKLPDIGPQHCAVMMRDGKVFVQDLDSSQPTVVNDSLLPPGGEWPLHSGDRIGVGPLEFMVQFHEKALSQRDAEEWALKTLDQDSESAQKWGEDDLHTGGQQDTAPDAAASILGKLGAQRGEVKGRLRIALEGGITVVRFNDPQLVEEAEIALIKKDLAEHLAKASTRVLLDFKNVRRMSSVAFGLIMGLYVQLRARGISLALCRLQPDVVRALESLGMGKKIACFPDKKDALVAAW